MTKQTLNDKIFAGGSDFKELFLEKDVKQKLNEFKTKIQESTLSPNEITTIIWIMKKIFGEELLR